MTVKRIRIVLDSKDANKNAQELDSNVRQVGATADKTAFVMKKLAAAIAGAFAAQKVIGFFKDAVMVAADFNQAMARVGGISRASAAELEALTETARNLGATTEFSASQAAAGLEYLARAGFSAEQSIAAIPAVLDLATAANMDLGRAADVTSNIMSGFGIAAENAGRVSDVLAGAASRANTDVEQLGEGIKYVGPVAQALGISLETTAASIGVLSDAGIQGGMAGTSLRAVLSRLSAPTKEAQKAIKALGIEIEDVNPASNDFGDILRRFEAGGLDAAQAFKIFGQEAAPAMLALIGSNAKVSELNKELNNMGGEAARIAGIFRDTLTGDLQNLNSAFEELQITVGNLFTDQARSSTQGLTDAIRFIAENMDAITETVTVLSAVLGTRLAVALAASAAGFAMKTLQAQRANIAAIALTASISKTAAATHALGLAARGAGTALAFLGGPVGILVTAAAVFGAYSFGLIGARDATKQLTGETDLLTGSIDKLTRAQADAMKMEVVKEIDAQAQKLIELDNLMKAMAVETSEGLLFANGFFNEEKYTKARAEMDTTKQRVNDLIGRMTALDDIISGRNQPVAPTKTDGYELPEEEKKKDPSLDRMREGTAAMQRELDLRRQVADIYRSAELDSMTNQFDQERALTQARQLEQLATAEAKFADDQARRAFQFESLLEGMKEEEEYKQQLRAEFAEQERLATEILDAEKTAIEERGAEDRKKIAAAERDAKISTWQNMATSGLQLISAFGSQSFNAQRNFAIGESGIAIIAAGAKALNNPYPANLGFAAQVLAQGAGLVRKLKQVKPGAGGSVPSMGASSPPTARPALAPAAEAPRTLQIEGFNEDSLFRGRTLEKLVGVIDQFHRDGGGSGRTLLGR